ncbi:MAG TPA: DUF6049 family protein [Actinotalea sp.]|nr:DUF6049 family protein [Actinotalea sp.]
MLALLVAVGVLTGAAPAARAETSPTVDVSITAITPTVLRPGTDLQVMATVINDGPEVAEPRLLLHLNRSGFISRSSLDRWRTAGPDDPLGATVAQLDLPIVLAAGASTTVTIGVPATDLGLPTSSTSWGARGLGLEVVDAADPARQRLGAARTFVVWYPATEVNPTAVSVLVPVTGPPPSDDAADELAALTSDGGRLASVVAATATSQAVSWAVDPWLLETALGQGPSPGGGEPSPGGGEPDTETGPARSWAQDVLRAAPGHHVTLLPWGDADVAALAHAGRPDLLDETIERSADRAGELGLGGTTDLLWPGAALPDMATASVAAARDLAILVGPGELTAASVLTYTPTGRSTLTTPRGAVEVLVPDERLSRALTVGSVAEPGAGTSGAPAGTMTGATAAADLLAELAVITRERPADARHLLITVPRTWHPSVDVARAQLAALASAPFVAAQPIASLASQTSPDIARGTLPDLRPDDREVAATTLDAVARAVADRADLATIVADPSAMLGDLAAERLAPTALAWREDPAGRRALADAAQTRTQELRSTVSAPPGIGLILLATSGELPLRVANALDQPVTVQVRLRPSDSRLIAGDPVTVQIPALDEQTVTVPVHGVLTADVDVTVELLTPTGELLNDATTLTVRVRAEWENIGAGVISAVLALMLVIGLVRTIRRGRRGSRASRQAAAVEPVPADQAVP